MTDPAIDAAVRLLTLGRAEAAARVLDEARAMRPDGADLAFAQGVVALERRAPRDAVLALREALALDPGLTQAYDAFARALAAPGRAALLRRWALLAPRDPAPLIALSHALRTAGDWLGARDAAERALALAPRDPGPRLARGAARHALGDLAGGAADFAAVACLDPALGDAWRNAALVATEASLLDAAARQMERARRLAPGKGEAEWGLALIHWLAGDLAQAWRWFDGRLNRPGILRPDIAARPAWRGEDFAGRTLLLWAEQGHGDTLQFIRYHDAIKARGGRVVVETQAPLARLFAAQGRFDAVIARGAPTGSFDLHLAMMSAPVIFDTRPETIPAPIPYLRAPGLWRLPAPGRDGLKVGLVWAGNPDNATADRIRSFPFETYRPLLGIKGVSFYSLQVGARREEAREVIDLAPHLTDFAVTADAVDQLDLLISSCTSVPHLAGALGRPVWLLLNKASDYRWGLNGATTPWYPTMTLYRQSRARDWSDPIEQVRADLIRLAGA